MPKPTVDTRRDVPINRLHLDPENPRHDPIADEDKIIAQLFKSEGVINMVRHIAEFGVNPLEYIGVVEMKDNRGHFVVVEGNRRTCALKVLRDPRKAPSPKYVKQIEELAKGTTVPTHLPVIIFPSREAARPWMSLRHLGPQGGAGMKPWSAAQKARFSMGRSPDELALSILDRAAKAEWLTHAEREAIGLTTLTRYLSNPVVRSALGLGSRSKLIYTHEPSEVDEALKQFLRDAIPKGDRTPLVHSRSKKGEREAYGRSIHTRGLAPRTSLDEPTTPPPPALDLATRRRRSQKHPDDRQTVIPSDFSIHCHDRNLLRLVKELKTLRPEDGFEFSANYVLRAVIERILYLYAKKVGKHSSGMKDTQLINACALALKADGVSDRDTKIMRLAISNLDREYSLDSLGSAVHGAHLPTRKGMISVWDNWEPALKLMLDRL